MGGLKNFLAKKSAKASKKSAKARNRSVWWPARGRMRLGIAVVIGKWIDTTEELESYSDVNPVLAKKATGVDITAKISELTERMDFYMNLYYDELAKSVREDEHEMFAHLFQSAKIKPDSEYESEVEKGCKMGQEASFDLLKVTDFENWCDVALAQEDVYLEKTLEKSRQFADKIGHIYI